MIVHERAEINIDDQIPLNDESPCAADAFEAELYEGKVQIRITPFDSFGQVKIYKNNLETINNVKVVSKMWSEEEGFSFIVEVKAPLALGHLLRKMPDIESVLPDEGKCGRGHHKSDCRKILVVMKATDDLPIPESD